MVDFVSSKGKCHQCFNKLPPKGQNIRKHYQKVHGWKDNQPPPPPRIKQIRGKKRNRNVARVTPVSDVVSVEHHLIRYPGQVPVPQPQPQPVPTTTQVMSHSITAAPSSVIVPAAADKPKSVAASGVADMFTALQTTFELLRPQTQQDVMKKLTTTVIDAFYRDQVFV